MENPKPTSSLLVVIGCAKLLKAVLLLVIATQLHLLMSPNASATLESWVHHLRIDPHNHYMHTMISRVTGVSIQRLHEIRLGSYIYAAIFSTEGIGLILRKRWAEYFTVISTGLLLPVEVYEMFRANHHVIKFAVFVLNVAIVVYLVMRLQSERPDKPRTAGPADS